MQIIAKCPKCSYSWLLEEDMADRRINCKKCNRKFKLPRLDEIQTAVNMIRQAKSSLYVDQQGKAFG